MASSGCYSKGNEPYQFQLMFNSILHDEEANVVFKDVAFMVI